MVNSDKPESLILSEYEEWLENGWGDKSRIPYNIIACIHISQSMDGYDQLPDWLRCDIEALLEDYRKTGKMSFFCSAGEFDISEKVATLDRLLKK